MTHTAKTIFISAIISAMGVGSFAASFKVSAASIMQDRGRLLGSYRKWDALVRTTKQLGKECYMISKPTRSKASKSGARRGDIFITVTHRPKFNTKSEFNAQMGYPLKDGSEVRASVDTRHHVRLFTEGQGAWAYENRDEQRLVSAMKRGNNLIVSGVSARGTATTDTYSLSGYTAAWNAISKECGVK